MDKSTLKESKYRPEGQPLSFTPCFPWIFFSKSWFERCACVGIYLTNSLLPLGHCLEGMSSNNDRGEEKRKRRVIWCVFFNGWLHSRIHPHHHHHSESREWWLRCESVPRTTSTLSAEQAPWTESSLTETPLQKDVTEGTVNVTSSLLYKHIMCEC